MSTNSSYDQWTEDAQYAAYCEGWGVFDNDEYGTRIERLDDPTSVGAFDGSRELAFTAPKFESDADAIAHVKLMASNGSAFHALALAIHKDEQAKRIAADEAKFAASWTDAVRL